MSDILFDKFKKTTKKEWVEKAMADLKGADPIEKFGWSIEPEIPLAPYYDIDDTNSTLHSFQNLLHKTSDPSGDVRHWDNLQQVEVNDVSEANKAALAALGSGADGILFSLKSAQLDTRALLNNIQLQYCSIWFEYSDTSMSPSILEELIKVEDLNGGYYLKDTSSSIKRFINNLPQGVIIQTGSVKSDADFTDKITTVLIDYVELVDQLTDAGLSAEHALSKVGIRYPLGTDFFGEIAAVRAIRQLQFQIAGAYGINNFDPQRFHVTGFSTAWVNEDHNPHSNMLKGTTAGLAAILGGCTSLVIEPENRTHTTLSRTAKNVASVLKEESYMNKVADPVAGSYYIESLTQQMAQVAWKKFQHRIK